MLNSGVDPEDYEDWVCIPAALSALFFHTWATTPQTAFATCSSACWFRLLQTDRVSSARLSSEAAPPRINETRRGEAEVTDLDAVIHERCKSASRYHRLLRPPAQLRKALRLAPVAMFDRGCKCDQQARTRRARSMRPSLSRLPNCCAIPVAVDRQNAARVADRLRIALECTTADMFGIHNLGSRAKSDISVLFNLSFRAFSGRPESKRDSHGGADLIHGAGWMEAGKDGQAVVDGSSVASAGRG